MAPRNGLSSSAADGMSAKEIKTQYPTFNVEALIRNREVIRANIARFEEAIAAEQKNLQENMRLTRLCQERDQRLAEYGFDI